MRAAVATGVFQDLLNSELTMIDSVSADLIFLLRLIK